MTKKNLKPQQAAPVQREINTTSSVVVGGTAVTPLFDFMTGWWTGHPFAGDDAEVFLSHGLFLQNLR
ncbi:anacyclamide/piricyclamide family prenylated cyclic peptide [Planktothrix mougeotii]|nr:anacyclamide/piricyclamide family prenylated cyclic peptide [Planktothrix mougeotii]